MKSAGKARNNGLYRHIRTSKEIIRNLLNDYINNKKSTVDLHRRVRNQRSFFIPIFKKEVNHNDKTENP